ncbi:vitamin B12 dependent methionine synthase, activation domain [Clostridium homopropionicum DSM 5847]|uniref:Vitamin B12 dependent methionine synthase, activation domain n=1 Tax=Clostridium homopropionicum DSM 5847 TaxID=1121318 RepID=A0A0L6ZEV8_9CLOT|nr:vitamin B12 dependent methionine synthase, activation domain [Clostridium homopropionicum DSM 5847]SFG06895.1 hypothetical protein SAMN04488501_10526 [Clostridium homopropionicum]
MEVNRNEVLRYLGYKKGNIGESISQLIDECIEEIKKYSNYKYTYKLFEIKQLEEEIELLNSNLILKGSDISHHLKDSTMCAVLGVTLGSLVDTKIKLYEKTNLTKALILDACASTAIEWVCDEASNKIKEEALNNYDLGITYRYSPGYGDFAIDIQPEIINALEAQKKIGLTVTETNILIPRKSVTAIIGFQDKNIISIHPGCRTCNNSKWCQLKKGGNYCGN